EAGYGPNLGPFVMTSVACRLPPELATADLWQTLQPAVRRSGEPADGRLLVEDSKVVYGSGRRLPGLEKGGLAPASPRPARARRPPPRPVGLRGLGWSGRPPRAARGAVVLRRHGPAAAGRGGVRGVRGAVGGSLPGARADVGAGAQRGRLSGALQRRARPL